MLDNVTRDSRGRFRSIDAMERQQVLDDFVLAQMGEYDEWVHADDYEEHLHGPVLQYGRGLFQRWSHVSYMECTPWEPIRLNKTLKNSRWED